MIYATLSLGLFLFIGAFHFLKIVSVTKDSIAVANSAFAAVRSPSLSDDQKELASRQAARRLFGDFFSILGRSLLAFAISALPVLIGVALDLFSLSEVSAAAINVYFIGGSAIVVLVMILVMK